MSQDRLHTLQTLLHDAQLDVAALVPGANLRYVAGADHMLMERPLVMLVPQEGMPQVVIPKLEAELFAAGGLKTVLHPWSDAEGYQEAFLTACEALRPARVGVEGLRMRYFEAEILATMWPEAHISSADEALAPLRLRKDAQEIEKLRQAVQLSEDALRRTLAEVQVGQTEQHITNVLVGHLNAVGGQGLSFPPLVLAGDNSARPHGHARDDYTIQPGDALLFDFGTMHEGYMADITRTFFVREPPRDDHRALYEAVYRANVTAREAARPGMTAHVLDNLTRAVLEHAGYGEWIIHRTGHGLGLDIHEYPNIVDGNPRVLEPGMVFTIEPGLYQTGNLGVRIEDNVVITAEGCESLTTFPREVQIVG